MDQDLKVGDAVRLKSGGPDMTLEGIGKYQRAVHDVASCVWFEGKSLKRSVFELHTLTKAMNED